MRNLFYFVLVLSGLLTSCSKTEVVISEYQIPENVFYLPGQLKPYTGKCLIYYPNTETVKEELNYRKGILNGPQKSFYSNGKIKRTGEYRNGRFHGNWSYWGNEGSKIYEVTYSNDTLSGKYSTWYANGQICEKGEYKGNIKNGTWLFYNKHGMLLNKRTYETN